MNSRNKITVAQVLPALTTGGVERGAIEISKEMIKKGLRPLIICGGGELESEIKDSGIEHIKLNIGEKNLSTLLLVKKLSQIFITKRVNIIHARSRLPAWISSFALRMIKTANEISWLTTVHGPYTVNYYSKIMVSGDKIIAVSDFIKKYILKNYNVEPKKIITIPRGVDTEKYHPEFKPDKRWLDRTSQVEEWLGNRPILSLPGRLTSWKGQAEFIDLLFDLKKNKILFHGLIIGGIHANKKNYYKFLNKKITNLGLSDNVTLLGNRHDLRQIMSISSITFSLTSKPEAFGRTTAESLSLGTPVIGYDYGGTGEILRKWFPIGLIEPFNMKEALERVRLFLTSPPKVPIENQFPLQNMLDETIHLYQKTFEIKKQQDRY